MFIERSLTNSILKINSSFKVLLLTGPRQVGKTTLLQRLCESHRSYITLDEIDTRLSAKEDPEGFIQRLKTPVFIDEVQYAPELFPSIKQTVDRKKENGLFWLTGSQQFSMMKNISESLAGRVGILELYGLSLAEEERRPFTPSFLPTPECLKERQKYVKPISLKNLFIKIWRGSYPHTVSDQGKTWYHFYESYITTYLERDVRECLNVDNLMTFRKFLQMAAARTGQMLNYRNISKEIGLSEPTVKSWFNVLNATGLVFLLPPYSNDLNKRLIKTPKFYFMDTGLCCFLTRWTHPEVLENGAMSGAILETYVISEIIKSYVHHGKKPYFYYYTDKEKREIDLLIEQNGKLYPIEIKKGVSIRNTKFKGFDWLKKNPNGPPIGHGCVLCFQENLLPYNSNVDIVPMGYL